MEVIHSRCAGMDVSKRDAKVCVRVAGAGRRKTVESVRTWASTTNAILALREHLIAGTSRQRAGLTMVIPATVARSYPGSIAAASSSPMVRSINRWGCSEPCSMSAIMPG